MVKNYLKIALRTLRRQRFYSFINISGLAIGLACTLLIVLFVVDELSYDRYNKNANRVYRIATEIKFGGKHFHMPYSPAPLAEALVNDYPEVQSSFRFRSRGRYLVKSGTRNFREEKLVFADSSIFSVFNIDLIYGDRSCLDKPNSIIIDNTTSRKYYGDKNPIGERLLLDNDRDVEVTGVYEDIPSQSHYHFSMMVSLNSLEDSRSTMWLSNNYITYLLLAPGADPDALAAKFPMMFKKYAGPQIEQFLNLSIDDWEAAGNRYRFELQPLTKIHLYSKLEQEIEPNGDIAYVYIFSAIALLILSLACINFMNLSTARSANRAKEVGVRKVLGSRRGNLVNQFLSESVLLSSISMVMGIGLARLALPLFNNISGKTLEFPWTSGMFWLIVIIASWVIGSIAGMYPAFFLSAFKPITVLKGKLQSGTKSGWLRSTLVVFQFSISTALIIGTIVIYDQIQFIQNKNLGFDKDQVLLVEDAYALGAKVNVFKEKILQVAGVQSASVSGYLPVSSSNRNDTAFWPEGESPDENNMVSMQIWSVDEDYLKTLKMQLIAGRNFSPEFPSDSTAMILNEKAVRTFGLTNPVGAHINTFDGGEPDKQGNVPTRTYEVIGVVKDFHFESMKQNINSLCLVLGRSRSYLSVKLTSADIKNIISQIKNIWSSMSQGQAFSYSFLDQKFDDMYKAESEIGRLFGVFTGLAIFIACLGLFGLAAFTAEQRSKEIGVRKAMGASIPGIVLLLSREFGRLVVISFLVAAPLAWLGMSRWLEDFQYRIVLNPIIFVLAGLLTLLIALATMSYQSIKAARVSPAKSLRDE